LSAAADLLGCALDEASRALAPASELASMHNARADLFRKLGRGKDAVRAAREGLAQRRLALPRSDMLVGNDLMLLALALADDGDREGARAAALEALDSYARCLGTDHPETEVIRAFVARLDRGAGAR
jgi:hypothetical protein